MNHLEMSKLLSFIAELDGRQFTAETVNAWVEVLGKYTVEECFTAVKDHHDTSAEFLKPGHIALKVKTARRERLNQLSGPVDVNVLDDHRGPDATVRQFGEYKQVRQEVSDAVASGIMSRATYQEYVNGEVPWNVFKQGLNQRRLES